MKKLACFFLFISYCCVLQAAVRIIEDESVQEEKSAVQERDIVNVVKSARVWKMAEGKTVSKELSAWATAAGWKVIWNLNKDWAIPATTSFTGDFKTVATEVVKTLSDNGVLIRAQFYDGNKTLIINGPGTSEQQQ